MAVCCSGFDNFGSLTGLTLFLNGLMSLSIYPLTQGIITTWAAEPAGNSTTDIVGEETSAAVVPFDVWRRISLSFLALTVLSGVYPLWLYRRGRTRSAQQASPRTAEESKP